MGLSPHNHRAPILDRNLPLRRRVRLPSLSAARWMRCSSSFRAAGRLAAFAFAISKRY